LAAAARAGSAEAQAKLVGPECPEELEDLVGLAWKLHGRSGMGFGALAPLSHREIEACVRLHDLDLGPEKVDALLVLDAAILDPDSEPETGEEPGTPGQPEPSVPEAAWPTRRAPPRFMAKEPE
jgi:hypothetical protein